MGRNPDAPPKVRPRGGVRRVAVDPKDDKLLLETLLDADLLANCVEV